MSAPEVDMFQGHPGRECGEHRTTGGRAWCFVCVAWCYPKQPCAGCERPMLRAEVKQLMRLVKQAPAWPWMAKNYPIIAALLAEEAEEAK